MWISRRGREQKMRNSEERGQKKEFVKHLRPILAETETNLFNLKS